MRSDDNFFQVVTVHGTRDIIHPTPFDTIRAAEECGERIVDRDDDCDGFFIIDEAGFQV